MTEAKYDTVYDAIVVGSGVGGLAAALSLAMMGLRPVVLEKSDLIASALTFALLAAEDIHKAAAVPAAGNSARVA